jgi:putative transposase
VGRKNRFAPPGFAYHVVNRGNDRQLIFRNHFDHTVFLELLAEGQRRFSVHIYGYCVMPNHVHLLLEPLRDGELSDFMQWVTCRYACHFRLITDTLGYGHVFQRRFWSAAAQDQAAFLTYLRYIEANPVRARLVPDADLWPWSSFVERTSGGRKILSPTPITLPENWAAVVNAPQHPESLQELRKHLVPSPGRPKGAKKG